MPNFIKRKCVKYSVLFIFEEFQFKHSVDILRHLWGRLWWYTWHIFQKWKIMSAHKRRLLQNAKQISVLACCNIFLQFPQTVNTVRGILKKICNIKELNLNVFDLELSDEERWRWQRPSGEMYDLPERVWNRGGC